MKPLNLTVLLVYLSLTTTCIRISKNTSANIPEEYSHSTFIKNSYNSLLNKLSTSESPIINLTESEFSKYVLTKPRVYSLVIFFTAEDCKPCHRRFPQIEKVAEEYRQQEKYRASKGGRNQPIRPPVFFVSINISKATINIARKFNVSHLPVIYYSTPEELALKENFSHKRYQKDNKWQITRDDGQNASHLILKWVNKRSGNLEVRFTIPKYKLAAGILLLLTLFLLLLVLRVKCPGLILNRNLWVVISLIFYIICGGGYLFARIFNMKFIEFDKQGAPIIFMRNTRSQSCLEGLLAGGLFVGFSWSMYLLQNIVTTNKRGFLLKWFLLLLNFFSILYLISFIEQIFRSKNFYNPLFFPPKYFVKGPLHKDRGIIA
jgi:oligosaccharyltransferase complex subunit gamma